MHPERYQEIRRFHQTLATRLEDPAPLTGFERAMAVQVMGELLDAARIEH